MTPLYYPNDNLHIGHAYSTVIADVLARYKKNCGYDVRFLTGSDEHGEKIEKKAKENNKEPLDFVNGIIKNFISL
jgi:methionyl-tRNA synthetase